MKLFCYHKWNYNFMSEACIDKTLLERISVTFCPLDLTDVAENFQFSNTTWKLRLVYLISQNNAFLNNG